MTPLRRFIQIAGLVAGILVMSGMGTNYGYSTYAPSMKANLNYTQTEINMIPAVGGIFAFFTSVGVGALYDAVGAAFVCVLGACLLFTGYFCMYLANEHVFYAPAILMAVFWMLISTGAQSGYLSAISTNIHNWPAKQKGKIVGVLLMAYGLSAAIVTQVYKSFFYPSVTRYFFFLSIFLASMTVPGMLFLRQLPKETPEPSAKSLIKKRDNEDEEEEDSESARERSMLIPVKRVIESPEQIEVLYPQYEGFAIIKHLEFYLIGFITFLGSGAGLLFINTLGSISLSWRITEIQYPTYVIILSLGNSAGRLLYGLALDQVAKRIPGIFLYLVCFSTIAIVHAVMALWQNYITLLIGTIINGISYGGSFAILPYVVNRYYGMKRYGFHLTIIGIFMQVATFFFSYTSGAIYDHYAQVIEDGEAKCYGAWCWSLTLSMTSCTCIIACWITVWIGIRERRYVKQFLADQRKSGYNQVN